MCKPAEDHETNSNATASQPTDLSFIPDNDICRHAYEYTATRLHLSILNHSIRVFLYAKHIATLPLPSSFDKFAWHRRTEESKDVLMFIAAMFHDLGTSEEFNSQERFEVCGADAAVKFMEGFEKSGLGGSARDDVWTAIACHSSPGIAEGIAPLARIIRLAVLTDFDRPGLREEVGVLEMCGSMEKQLPRLSIEIVLGDAVVAQVMSKPDGKERLRKAPTNSWPGGLWRGYLEMREKGVEGVNIYF